MTQSDEGRGQPDVDALFSRWAEQMEQIEAEFAAPKPPPMSPGAPVGSPPSPEWVAEMARRGERLRPLAHEMALAFEDRLNARARHRASALLSTHARVTWQLPSVIARAYERYLDTKANDDLRLALALTALYDARATSRDFLRIIIPVRHQMQRDGLDPGRIFDDAVALTNRHPDPEYGAHGLFVSLGRRWDEPEPE